jgi:hypothetical protein
MVLAAPEMGDDWYRVLKASEKSDSELSEPVSSVILSNRKALF